MCLRWQKSSRQKWQSSLKRKSSRIIRLFSMKSLLDSSVQQLKRSSTENTESQLKEIKKLKYSEPHKFKKKANEDQYKFNTKLADSMVEVSEALAKKEINKAQEVLQKDIFHQSFWKDLSGTEDEDLFKLADRMKKTVLASRASSTVTSYLRSLKRWKSFTEQHKGLCYFPAESSHVALYLQHILETACSYHSVDAAFYALKWAHNIAGIPSPTDNSVVNFVREGAKRILGTSKINRKEPLTTEQLNLIVTKANLELRNICMYSLAFVGLLRFDDLVRIKRSDLFFNPGYLKIIIPKSKNDQLRKGNEVLISETTSSTSPIKLLKLYLSRVQIPDDCHKFIFRPMVKSKSNHSLVKDDRHISYTTFRENLKSDLEGIVQNPAVYSSHSLRSGGATKAANTGMNDRLIQRHGRWRSATSRNMYIDDSLSRRLEVSKTIQQ